MKKQVAVISSCKWTTGYRSRGCSSTATGEFQDSGWAPASSSSSKLCGSSPVAPDQVTQTLWELASPDEVASQLVRFPSVWPGAEELTSSPSSRGTQ